MLRWFLRRQVAAFERAWDYDASYLRALIDADPRAMLAFGKLRRIVNYRKDVPPAVYAAARLVGAMPEDVALTVRFAEAALGRGAEADGLRDEIVRRFGRRALISLTFALLAARMYPTVKYALGYGQTCTRLTIGGETQPVLHAARPPVRAATAA